VCLTAAAAATAAATTATTAAAAAATAVAPLRDCSAFARCATWLLLQQFRRMLLLPLLPHSVAAASVALSRCFPVPKV
jgi:hypothetical protein